MKEKISVEEEKMGKLQEKLTAIKEQLDKNDNNRPDANSELGIAKAKFNAAKTESRRLQQVARRRSNTERGPSVALTTPWAWPAVGAGTRPPSVLWVGFLRSYEHMGRARAGRAWRAACATDTYSTSIWHRQQPLSGPD